MAHEVFVSYSTKDKSVADAVVATLEQQQLRCWYAPRDVPAGANFADSIIGAIDECKVFVLIWSAHTNTSEHILNEINRAFDQGIVIIPFRIQDIQPTRAMSYYFGRTHWLDALTPPLEKHITVLGNTILKVFGREPISEPMPAETSQAKQEPVAIPEPKSYAVEKPAKTVSKLPTPKKIKETKTFSDIQHAPVSIKKYLPYVAAGMVVLTLAGELLSGKLKRSPASDAEQITTQATESTQPVDIPVPEITPLPNWAEEFSSIIMAAIKERPPDFADDFSQQNSDWTFNRYHPNPEGDGGAFGCAHTNTDDLLNEISDGVLKVSVKGDCSQVFIGHPKLNFRNFVWIMDVGLMDEDLIFVFGKSININGKEEWFIEYKFNKHNWQISVINIEKASGKILLDTSQPVKLKLISKDQTSLFYINNNPVAFFDTKGEPEGIPSLGFALVSSQLYPQECQLDNLQIWDLDRIDDLPMVVEMDGEKTLLTPITNPDNQNRYLYIEHHLNWHQARDYCAQMGAHLVTIETLEENNFVFELSGGISWLGASDEVQEGVWVWVDGSPFDFQFWWEGFPDNSCIDGICENYLSFFDAMGYSEWNDRPNDDLPFVCEWETTETR